MTYYHLHAVHEVGSSTAAVCETLELAQKIALDYTPKNALYDNDIAWTPHYEKQSDIPYAWTGHMNHFTHCDYCRKIIQWNIEPRELNTCWLLR